MVRPGPGPFRREFAVPLSALQGELNRLLEHYWPTVIAVRPHRPQAAPSASSPSSATQDRPAPAWVPAVDLYETPEEVVLLADLPGVNPDAIDLTIDGRTLTLRGEKAPATGEGPVHPQGAGAGPAPGAGATARTGIHAREREFGAFLRQVNLPTDVDIDAVRAEAVQGVLHVHLPKAEAAKARHIPINPA